MTNSATMPATAAISAAPNASVSPGLNFLAPLVGLAILAFLATWANLAFLNYAGQIAIVWPTEAIVLSFILRAPRAVWPWTIAIAYVADVLGTWVGGMPLAPAAAIAISNLCEQLVVVMVLPRVMPLPPDLSRARNLVLFALVAGLAGPLVSAVLGGWMVFLSKGIPVVTVMERWVIDHSLGALIIAPLLLMMRAEEWRYIMGRELRGETTLILALVAMTALAVFYWSQGPTVFLLFPFLILAAFRLRFAGTALAIAIVTAISIPLTLSGFGPFADPGTPLTQRIVPLQIFLAVTVFTLFPIAAVLTERRRLEEDAIAARRSAEQANHAKSAFLAHMSHELRTPMTGIIGICDLLRAGPQSMEQRSLTDALQRSARAFVDLLNDVLDLAKIEAGRMELDTADFRLSHIVQEIEEFFAPAMGQKGLTFAVRAQLSEFDVVGGDPKRLRQILLNLIGNALKFTDRGEVTLSVQVKATGNGLQARFEVADSGIGIPEEALARLFQPFEQGDSSTSRRFGGTGLGLYICKQLVAEMGGEISAESRKGEGSRFTFTVPFAIGLSDNVTERPTELAGESGAILNGLALTVLLAEDNPTTQLLITKMMTLWGHSVVVANDGQEAITKALNQDFDIVLMDMQMPVVDGLQATRRIRAGNVPRAKVPIIAFTADALVEHHVHYYTAGCNAIVTKPIQWDVLARRIKALVTKSADTDQAEEALIEAPVLLPVLDPAWINALKGELSKESVRGLLISCLDSMDRYLADIRASAVTGDRKAARRAAHDLKGICGQFGALQASDIARRIESEIEDAEGLKRAVIALEASVREASAEVRRIEGSL